MRFRVCAALAALALAGCDNGPSAVAQKDTADRAVSQAPTNPTADLAGAAAPASAAAAPTAPTYKGKPLWSSTRTYTSEANAARAFRQNGAELGAKDVDDYVRLAHQFIDKPPRGVLTYKRPNGDLMLYDARSNTFAVATKDGAPRTLFKPREGEAYWQEQMIIEKARNNS